MKIKKSPEQRIFEVFNTIFMLCLMAVMLYPFLYVVAASLSNETAVLSGNIGIIPSGFNIRAYQVVLRYPSIWTAYRNTIMYTLVGTGINLVMTVCGAYPLSRKRFYGRSVFTFFIAFTMFFSGGMIPTYLVIQAYGMVDTFWVMVIPTAISTWNMIIMRTFFQGIPDAMEEAAIIDGCNDIQVLFRIILPLSTASIMTIGLFYAVDHWNRFMQGLIYLRDANRYPLQLVLRQIVLQNQVNDLLGGDWGVSNDGSRLMAETVKYATIVVAVVPILCVYPFIQKYFVKGVMVGSIKG